MIFRKILFAVALNLYFRYLPVYRNLMSPYYFTSKHYVLTLVIQTSDLK